MRTLRPASTMDDMADPRPAYLARLDAALVGPARTRRSLVQEASDHLDDATAALVRAGWDEETAARRAVADFGTVPEVAASFQTTLAVAASRRTAWLLLLVLGYQPFLWDSGLELASETHAARPDWWLVGALDELIEIGGGLTLLGALVALVLTGVGNRWLAAGRVTARVTAGFTLAACAFVPLTCVAMTLAAGGWTVGFWGLVVALMMLPLSGVAVSARGTLAAA
ncbi:permease prefix domain 1-containing protein [Nocardioides sp.]|uniref:permease prefix domain 1-containing protein n=1 Tax=Nocardioides sp. TaxID=35761 RepID=UPI001A32F54D|nr:permease prefix domain 1-containing protein [Nocardioides sp.]MBJ7355915.1 hypothetical protein [Nocardioides sp.]